MDYLKLVVLDLASGRRIALIRHTGSPGPGTEVYVLPQQFTSATDLPGVMAAIDQNQDALVTELLSALGIGASEVSWNRPIGERFLKEDWVEVFTSAPGVRSYVVKGNRGVEVGRYLLVIEFDRVATRDLYWPTATEESDIWKQVSTKGLSRPEAIRAEDRWAALVPPEWIEDYTDWELVAE